jgi:thioredoxin-like negative regulator of GroEL
MKFRDIVIVNVEVDQMPLLKAKYKKNISGFPTILKYQNGKKIQEFSGDRKPKQLHSFIKTKII